MFKIFFYINELKDVQKKNLNQLNNINIIYRNYERKNYKKNAMNLSRYCKVKKFKFYISNDIKLATRLGCDGVYLPSFNTKDYFLNSHLKVIGSAHNEMELRTKIKQGCKEIFISPIFDTHKEKLIKKGVGVNFYRNLMFKFSKLVRVYALGGINDYNIKKLITLGSTGFASISFIEKKIDKNLISYLNLIATKL